MKHRFLFFFYLISNICLLPNAKAQAVSHQMQHSLDSVSIKYEREVLNRLNEYGLVGDIRLILLPVFYASDENIVLAKSIYNQSNDLDFERLTNLTRSKLIDYVDWNKSVLTETLVYINNRYAGFLWQSDIDESWWRFYAKGAFEHDSITADALYNFVPDSAFRLHNINHIIFLSKDNQLYCYLELSNRFIPFKDVTNFIGIEDFAAFFNIQINAI